MARIRPDKQIKKAPNTGYTLISDANGEYQHSAIPLGDDKYYSHTQVTPSALWTVAHSLNKKPSVFVTDSGGTVVQGLIHYVDDNNLTITFSAAFAGKAECN